MGTAGNKAVTGLGFKPRRVRFSVLPTNSIASIAGAGWGMMTATSQYAAAFAVTNSPSYSRASSTSACIGWTNGGTSGFAASAAYVSLDNDGFTISVTSGWGTSFDVGWDADA